MDMFQSMIRNLLTVGYHEAMTHAQEIETQRMLRLRGEQVPGAGKHNGLRLVEPIENVS